MGPGATDGANRALETSPPAAAQEDAPRRRRRRVEIWGADGVVTGREDFGPVLAELRAARGWSQARLAARAALTTGAISRFESGERGPARATVARLAAALGLPAAARGRLLAAAGFRPEAGDDPLLAELAELLADGALPAAAAADVRALVRAAVERGRAARGR